MAGDRLEVAEDLEFQRKAWIFERIGWAAFGAVVAGAALGLFGRGPLTNVVAAAPGGFSVDYPRFARMQSPITLEVTLPPDPATDGSVRVWMSADYLRDVTIAAITPQPDGAELDDGRIAFIFSRGGGGQARVSFSVEGQVPGTAFGEIGVDDGPPVAVRQFFYP